jgi:membrane protein implicated in regulation of membrane protease activity
VAATTQEARMPAILDLGSWFVGLTALEMFYVAAAALGGLVFLVRFVLMLVVGDGSTDFDGVEAIEGGDSSFQFLSVQGVSGLVVMFGLVGIALLRAGFSELASVVGAFVAGGLTMLVIAQLSRAMMRLQSSGNIDIHNAVGAEGRVYLAIPSGGIGSAQITIQNRLRTYDAICSTPAALETGTRIRVIDVSGGALVVEKL